MGTLSVLPDWGVPECMWSTLQNIFAEQMDRREEGDELFYGIMDVTESSTVDELWSTDGDAPDIIDFEIEAEVCLTSLAANFADSINKAPPPPQQQQQQQASPSSTSTSTSTAVDNGVGADIYQSFADIICDGSEHLKSKGPEEVREMQLHLQACTDIIPYDPPLSLCDVDFTDELDLIGLDVNGHMGSDLLLRATTMIQGWDDLEYETNVSHAEISNNTDADISLSTENEDDERVNFDSIGNLAQGASTSKEIPSGRCKQIQTRRMGSVEEEIVEYGVPSSNLSPQDSEMNSPPSASSSGSLTDSTDDSDSVMYKQAQVANNCRSGKKGVKGVTMARPAGKNQKHKRSKSSAAVAHKPKAIRRTIRRSGFETDECLAADPSEVDEDLIKWDPLKCGLSKRKGTSCRSTTGTWKDLLGKNVVGSDKDRQRVVQALYTFEELRQSFIGVEGARAAEGRAVGLRCNPRADLRASKQMKADGLRVNTSQCIGNVPGIHLGDRFWYRIEMVVVGLHQQLEGGIAYIGKNSSPSGVSLATSIVMKHSSNPYQDDAENGDLITYTGQGGNTTHGINVTTDQVLKRGNEALKNSCQHCKPIRVIRGNKDERSPTGESYTYIGLYQVMAMRYETGVMGNLVYKFDLRRLPGQPHLESIIDIGGGKPTKSKIMKGKGSNVKSGGGKRVCKKPSHNGKGWSSYINCEENFKKAKSAKADLSTEDESSSPEDHVPKWKYNFHRPDESMTISGGTSYPSLTDTVPRTLTWEGESSMNHDNSERPVLKWKDSCGKGRDIADG